MINEQVTAQLQELLRDRESFINGDEDHDNFFLQDIRALNAAIKIIEAAPEPVTVDGMGLDSLPLPVSDVQGKSVEELSIKEWFEKIGEEVFEAHAEAKYMSLYRQMDDDEMEQDCKERLAEELTDIITVCTSYLHALGYDFKARAEFQRKVNAKNATRGYFI